MSPSLALLLVLALTACGADSTPSDPADSTEPGDSTEPAGTEAALKALHENIAETAARAEHDAAQVTVSHILISFAGAERSTQTRSKAEAEVLSADLLQRIQAGEDFEALKREHSNDPGGGTYTMTAEGASAAGAYPRAGMAPAFGDVGWRLEVGEVGVAAYHPVASGFGWHIIQRVK